MKLQQHPLSNLVHSVVPILAALTLALLFPLSAFAQHQNVPATTTSIPCLQAPANLDVTTLTTTQLMSYGLPLRPPNPNAYAYWLQTANRIKTDKHICHPQLITGPMEHHSHHFPTSESNNNDFAGNYTIQPYGPYFYSSANWNLPCVNTSTKSASASEWVGLGGLVTPAYLVQAGTDEYVSSSGQVSYKGWIESTALQDYTSTWQLSASCGAQVYAEADSIDGNYDYFVLEVANLSYSNGPYTWPTSDGSTGECLVENPNDKNQYPYFTDFNYIAFTNCNINGTAINQLQHNYYNMYSKNNSSREMAATGPITGNGNYNIYWKAAN